MFIHRNPSHLIFGLPAGARFFFEEDDGASFSGAESGDTLEAFEPGDGLPVTRQSTQPERVEGEKLPDFGTLGGKKAAATPAAAPESAEAPAKPEKPATGHPDAADKPPKPDAKPIGTPAKVAEPAKPAEKPPEKVEKPAKEPTKEPTKPAEAPKIPSDAEIEALQPKPGAPTQVVKDFGAMRTKMKEIATAARTVEEEAQRLRSENETLKQSTGQLPEDVAKELEELRNFNLLFRAEQDPRFRAQFEAPITKTEEGIYAFLQKNGLQAKVIDEIKATAAAAGGDLEAWNRWGDLIAAMKNPVDQQELVGALKSRRDAIAAKQAHLAEIGSHREKFQVAVGNMDAEERQKFAQGVEQASIKLAAGNDWILEQDIPADAAPEQRTALEKANATVKARAEAFAEGVRDAYTRDPQKVAALALNAVKAAYLTEQLDSVTKERDKSSARVAELEARLAKIKSAGRMAHVEAPVVTKAAPEDDGKVGGDGAAALHNFFNNRK